MTKNSKMFFLILVFSIFTLNVFAQDDDSKIMDIPNLTATQKTDIKAIKQKSLDKRKTLKAERQTLVEDLKTLMLAKTPSSADINAKVEEINKKRSEMFKNAVQMHVDIKALLTDEQKTWYDENILAKFLTKEKE